GGCTDSDDAPACQLALVDDLRVLCREYRAFAVDAVILNTLDGDGLERAQANFQRAVGEDHAFFAQLEQQIVGEVQSGGWRGCRAFRLAVYGLVAFGILQRRVDVGRQGNAA